MIAVSFFAGAGGLDIGMKRAGFDIKLAVELESIYCKTLSDNNPTINVKQGNIMDYNKAKIYRDANLPFETEIDIMFGGSPCQSFSTAGNRQAFGDPRGQAMLKFAELIGEVKPKAFLLENVKGLLSAALKHRPIVQRGKGAEPYTEEELPGSALRHLLSYFEKDYEVTFELVNAADYGVPQARERVIFVGIRKDLGLKFNFPARTHSKDGKDGKIKWITLGNLLNKIKVDKHHYVKYTPERLKYMKMIPQGGGNWRDLPGDIVKSAMGGAYESGGGKVGFFRRLWVDRPAPTILTSPNQKSTNLGHPYEDRPLSIEEYLAIQEFPLDYQVAGNLTQQYVQIGNAVPTRLGEIIGKSIAELLMEDESTNFKYNRMAALG